MKILHEWHFHNRVCRVVESDPGIVHFEEATRTTGDPSIMLFNHTPTPMGAANEIIQLSMALAEANVINRDLSAAIQRWQEERNSREQEIERLRRRNADMELTQRKFGAFMHEKLDEIERLEAELAKTKLPIWMLREDHEKEVAALRGELADWEESARKAAGERCEDEIHCCCVPYLRVEIDRLRAREKLWAEYVALLVESEKLTITMFHVHGGRFPDEMIERGQRLRAALGME